MNKSKIPVRLLRMIRNMSDTYVWKHGCTWGQSKEDVRQLCLETVWQSGARTPQAAKRAIEVALSQARDDSKYNRRRLEPYQARKASDDDARQQALSDLNDDFAMVSQETSGRELDRLRVRRAIISMNAEDRQFWKEYRELGSLAEVAAARGIAATSFRRNYWEGFKVRFIKALEETDIEMLARLYASNPYVRDGQQKLLV